MFIVIIFIRIGTRISCYAKKYIYIFTKQIKKKKKYKYYLMPVAKTDWWYT